jgi:hypothetical protein
MTKNKKQYITRIILLGIITSLLVYGLISWGIPQHAVLLWPLVGLAVLFAVISAVNGLILLGYVDKRPQLFIRSFMASMTIKFVVYLGILVAYSLTWRLGVVPIVAVFFSLFALYTIVEKTMLFAAFRAVEKG